MEKYCANLRGRALRALAQEAAIRKKSLPSMIGQVQTELDLGQDA
jgi:hypothetical protein